jgi:hypothetical protein
LFWISFKNLFSKLSNLKSTSLYLRLKHNINSYKKINSIWLISYSVKFPNEIAPQNSVYSEVQEIPGPEIVLPPGK